MERKRIIIASALISLVIFVFIGFILSLTKRTELSITQSNQERLHQYSQQRPLQQSVVPEQEKLLCINNESDDILFQKEQKMRDLKTGFTPEEIVSGVKGALFNYDNDINPTIDDSCSPWKMANGIEFGPAGSRVATTIRSELLSVKKDEQLLINFLKRNQFEKSEDNSGSDYDKTEVFGEKSAYERGDLKCVISWDEVSVDQNSLEKIYFSFECSLMDKKAMEDFDDIFPAFENYQPPAGYTKGDEPKRFCIRKKNNDFATGMKGGISAPNWYAKKVNGKWTMQLITQDDPLCERVDGFPVDYYGGQCSHENVPKE